jgi:hypothetical protein
LEITGSVAGGTVNVASSGTAAIGSASGNKLNLANVDATGAPIYGGFLTSTGTFDNALATGNSVMVSGTTTASSIQGGFVETAATTGDDFAGNSLHVYSPAAGGIVVNGDVSNFERYDFTFDNATLDNAVGITVDGAGHAFYLNDQDSAGGLAPTTRGSVINSINVTGGSDLLTIGKDVRLVATANSATINKDYFTPAAVTGQHGALVDYVFSVDPATMTATVETARLKESAKMVPEAHLGSVASVIQGSDHLVGQALDNAVTATYQNVSGELYGAGQVVAPFLSVAGGNVRYETGSHVEARGISLVGGLAYGADIAPGRITVGGFAEYGNHDYDTENTFNTIGAAAGRGDTDYVGGGLVARVELNGSADGNFYAEASGRGGRVKNRFETGSLRDPLNKAVSFETTTPYYGLHAGLGYKFHPASSAGTLDIYGKYLWSHVNAEDALLSSGDSVHFDPVDSQRARAGVKYTHALSDTVAPFVGAAFEHEFDGQADAYTYGVKIPSPTMKGSTGMGELGLRITPGLNSPYSADLGVQGYMGKRGGVTGNLTLKMEF